MDQFLWRCLNLKRNLTIRLNNLGITNSYKKDYHEMILLNRDLNFRLERMDAIINSINKKLYIYPTYGFSTDRVLSYDVSINDTVEMPNGIMYIADDYGLDVEFNDVNNSFYLLSNDKILSAHE